MNALLFAGDPFAEYENGDRITFEDQEFEMQDGLFVPVSDDAAGSTEPSTESDPEDETEDELPELVPVTVTRQVSGTPEEESEDRAEFHNGFVAGVQYYQRTKESGVTPREPVNYVEIDDPFDVGFEAGLTYAAFGVTEPVARSTKQIEPATNTSVFPTQPEPSKGYSTWVPSYAPAQSGVTPEAEKSPSKSLSQGDYTTFTVTASVGTDEEIAATVPLTHVSLRREGEDNVSLRFYSDQGEGSNLNGGGVRVNLTSAMATKFAEELSRLTASDLDQRASSRTSRGRDLGLAKDPNFNLIAALLDRYNF